MAQLRRTVRVLLFSLLSFQAARGSEEYGSSNNTELNVNRYEDSNVVTSRASQYASNLYQSTSRSLNASVANRNKYRSSSYYSFSQYSSAHTFSVCQDSVVRVTSLFVVCDSPYTFYYGNGANRNSPVCNYGDKLSMQVTFKVVDNIEDNENIFMTMAIYDDQNNLLISQDPIYLCEDLVGYQCTNAGFYGFSTRLRLPYPYDYSDNNHFYPQIQMAFSTKADSGYNLGAMNVQCAAWDHGSSVEWTMDKVQRSPAVSFVINYGLLLATCVMMSAVALFVWRQAVNVAEIESVDDDTMKSKTESLISATID